MGVVNGHFGPESVAQLVVLLDPGARVVDVERSDHALGEHRVRKPPAGGRMTRRSKIKAT
jgi:hypothetical protein